MKWEGLWKVLFVCFMFLISILFSRNYNRMDWKEIHRECLERRLKDEEALKASLIVDLEVQDKMIEGIKEELGKLEKKL